MLVKNSTLESFRSSVEKNFFTQAIEGFVGDAVLGADITVVIVGHGVDNRAVHSLGEQLTQRVIGIRGSADDLVFSVRVGLHNGGDPLLCIVCIGDGIAAGEGDLADQIGSGRGLQLSVFLVLFIILLFLIEDVNGPNDITRTVVQKCSTHCFDDKKGSRISPAAPVLCTVKKRCSISCGSVLPLITQTQTCQEYS